MYGHKSLPNGTRQRGWFPKPCVDALPNISKKDK